MKEEDTDFYHAGARPRNFIYMYSSDRHLRLLRERLRFLKNFFPEKGRVADIIKVHLREGNFS